MAILEHTKSSGRAVGVLYVLGTVFGILSVAVTNNISGSDDILAAVSANESQLILGAFLVLLMGLVLAMIPIVAYPILSAVDPLRARGYFLFRSVLETVAYLLMVVTWLLLIPLSGSSDVSSVFGKALFDQEGAVVVTAFFFLIGAALFYSILFQGRLVPRWISVWGLVAIAPYLVAALLLLFTNIDDGTATLLEIPLALQEMVLAVWLIVKGFSTNQS
jgi:hypothetical protein